MTLGAQHRHPKSAATTQRGPMPPTRAMRASAPICAAPVFSMATPRRGEHAGDEGHHLPFDGLVGLLHFQAAGDEAMAAAGQGGDGDGRQAQDGAAQHGDHDGRGQGRLVQARGLGRGLVQDQEVVVAGHGLQTLARPVDQQGVAELQGHVLQARAGGPPLAQDGQDAQPVVVPEEQVVQGLAGQGRAGREQHLGHADLLRFQLGGEPRRLSEISRSCNPSKTSISRLGPGPPAGRRLAPFSIGAGRHVTFPPRANPTTVSPKALPRRLSTRLRPVRAGLPAPLRSTG